LVSDHDIRPPEQLTVRKEDDFMEWYNQVLLLAGIIDRNYDVKGMFVWLDYGLQIMMRIKSIWDEAFKRDGIKEMYFPLIVPIKYASMNKEFFEGFRQQVFWVKGYDDSEAQHILRPTGEPAMYAVKLLKDRIQVVDSIEGAVSHSAR
jgi:prolyl-tRNA synthetase